MISLLHTSSDCVCARVHVCVSVKLAKVMVMTTPYKDELNQAAPNAHSNWPSPQFDPPSGSVCVCWECVIAEVRLII